MENYLPESGFSEFPAVAGQATNNGQRIHSNKKACL